MSLSKREEPYYVTLCSEVLHIFFIKNAHGTTQLFVQQLIQVNTMEPSKLHITGPLWRESTSDWWIPLTKGQ